MTASKIRDFKLELKTIADRLTEIFEVHQIPASFRNDITKQMDKFQPSLMFYGIYNAGKSTLLNAIFGEFKASVADVPETNVVTPYKWNGYDLVDTPGINGPKKDYKLSKQELIKHDVVMFVIDDSDTFDNKLVAEEIVEILANEKPLIIVLNHKQTVGKDDQNINTIRNKLYENIKIAAEHRNLYEIDQKYSFITVNARSAFNGREKGKNLLVEKSNIQNLEILILQKLKEQAGIKLLLPPADILYNHAKHVRTMLQDQLANDKEKQLLELINDVNEKKNSLFQIIQSRIRYEFHQAFTTLYTKLSNNQDIDAEMEQLNGRLTQIFNEEMEATLTGIQRDLDHSYQEIKLAGRPVKVAVPQGGTAEMQVGTVQAVLPANDVSLEKVITTAVAKVAEKSVGKEAMIKVMEKGATQFAKSTVGKTVIKKLGLKGLAPIIAPIAPIVNVVFVLSVVNDIVSLFKDKTDHEANRRQLEYQAQEANQQQQEALTQRVNALQELRTQLNLQLFKMEEETIEKIKEGLTALFGNIIEEIKEDLDMVVESNTAVQQSLEEINVIVTEIESFKMNLV